MNYNEQLQQLQEKISQKQSLNAKLQELHSQHKELTTRVKELKKIMWEEQADVDRLERTGLTSVFYAILGKKEDRLDKEKMEAYAAKVKHDTAAQELQLVEEDIQRLNAQLGEITGCEEQYAALLLEKASSIKASGSADAERILQLEEQITAQKVKKKELEEAISAGSRALRSAKSILSSLDDAEGLGALDLFGGGLISSLVKHSRLDEAQEEIQQLQTELRQFKTELADVTIQADMQVSIEGFLRFADFFFDGLFVDWAVLDEINKSKASVESTKNQIETVLAKLRAMVKEADQRVQELEAEKNVTVVRAAL